MNSATDDIPPFPSDELHELAIVLADYPRVRCFAWIDPTDHELRIDQWVCLETLPHWTRISSICIPHGSLGQLELLLAGTAGVRMAGPTPIDSPSYSIDDAQRIAREIQTILLGAVELGGISLALDLVVNMVARFLLDARVSEDQMIGAIRKTVALLGSITKN